MKLGNLNSNQIITLGIVLIMVIVLLLGGFALNQMMNLAQLTTYMYDHPLAVSKSLLEIESHINAMHRSMKDVALSETIEANDAARSHVNEHEQHANSDFSVVFDRYLGDSLEVDLAYNLFSEWKGIRDEVIVLSRAGSNDSAINITQGKGALHVQRLNKSLRPMINFAENKASQFLQESERQKKSSIIFMIIVIIIFSAIAGVVLRIMISSLKASEQKQRDLIHNMRDGVVIVNASGEILFTNPSYASMLGYSSPAEMNKTSIIDTYANLEDREKLLETLKRDGFVERMELDLTKKDGTVINVVFSSTTSKDDEGNIHETESIVSDITERKQAEEKLRIKEFAFQSSMSADSIGNNEGILTYANPSFAKLWGYSNVDEVLGRPILDFLANKDEALEVIESLTSTGSWAGEYTALRKDGSTFIAQSYANAVFDSGGNQTALYSSVMDITDRKKVDEALQESNSLLTSIIESPNNIIMFALDTDYNYLSFNQAHVDTMKAVYDADIEIGEHILSYMPVEEDRLAAEIVSRQSNSDKIA
jgi:PAS domain S-box-containing protein